MMIVKTDKQRLYETQATPPPPPLSHLPTNTLQQNKDTKLLGMMLIGFPAHIPFLKNNESTQISAYGM